MIDSFPLLALLGHADWPLLCPLLRKDRKSLVDRQNDAIDSKATKTRSLLTPGLVEGTLRQPKQSRPITVSYVDRTAQTDPKAQTRWRSPSTRSAEGCSISDERPERGPEANKHIH